MTANYFMLTKDGVDLYADYPDIARGGAGPTATAVTDKVSSPLRLNLINDNPSFESNLSGWASINSTNMVRSSAQAADGSWSALVTASGAAYTGLTRLSSVAVYSTGLMLSFKTRPVSSARSLTVVVNAYDAGDTFLGQTSYSVGTQVAGQWTFHETPVTVPAGTASVKFDVRAQGAAVDEQHYFDDIWLWPALDPTITGVPADLAGYQWLQKSKGYSVAPRDIVAPTGFVQSVFRAVRDPAVVGDDSATALAMQVYNHGWVMGVPLACYLAENPFDGVAVPWPADGGYKVVPVTGTPAVNDGAGTYGFTSVTWPGSGVGVGTLRQLVSGDEGTGRKVAAILDLLAPLGDAERSNIASVFSGTRASIETARQNMETVIGAATDAVRAQVDGRSALAGILGCNAVAASAINSPLRTAVLWAMRAIVAKEAGLVLDGFPGTRLSVANYETLTQPLDQVLAMPSGY